MLVACKKELAQKEKARDAGPKLAMADQLGKQAAAYVRDTFPALFELLKDHAVNGAR